MAERLNDTRVTDSGFKFGTLTANESAQVTAWYLNMATNIDPDKVMRPPECYKPICAFMHMQGIDLVNAHSDLKPWNTPQPLVDYFCSLWYANRVALLTAMQQEKSEPEHGSRLADMMFSSPDKHVGRA